MAKNGKKKRERAEAPESGESAATADATAEPGTTSAPTDTENATGAHQPDGSVAPDGNNAADGVDTTPTEPTTKAYEKVKADSSLRSTFKRLSGYSDEDIIGSSDSRRTFVTSNGGKYEVSPKGKKLRRLAGPPTPKELEPEEEEDE